MDNDHKPFARFKPITMNDRDNGRLLPLTEALRNAEQCRDL